MRITIIPPNQVFYMERCKAARDCFQHADIMPPFLVTLHVLLGYVPGIRWQCRHTALRAWSGILRQVEQVPRESLVDVAHDGLLPQSWRDSGVD